MFVLQYGIIWVHIS